MRGKRKWGKREREKEGGERERLSVACLCLMEVPGVALGLLHYTINGGSLGGKPCFSITPTRARARAHKHAPSDKLNSAPERCLDVSLLLCREVPSSGRLLACLLAWLNPELGLRAVSGVDGTQAQPFRASHTEEMAAAAAAEAVGDLMR